jgi:hypothetical protein
MKRYTASIWENKYDQLINNGCCLASIVAAVLLVCVFSGCVTSQYVVCIKPRGEFNPKSESKLLAELNSQLPFTIQPKNFIAKQKASGIVGWAVLRGDNRKDEMKAELKKSTTLNLLQVEALTPEFNAVIQDQKK